MILVLFIAYHSHNYPNKNKLVNIEELLLPINLTILYAALYQNSERIFCIVTNVMISLAFIPFCTIVLYHFLMYTCYCNIVGALQTTKQAIMKYFTKSNKSQNSNYQQLLDIPDSGGSRISKREVSLQHKCTTRPYLHDNRAQQLS